MSDKEVMDNQEVIKRLGFACKFIDNVSQVNGIKATDDAKQYNTRATTVAWLSRQTKRVVEERLISIIEHNLDATYKLIKKVSEYDEHFRMVRISSDLLPVYTHPNYNYFYQDPDVISILETEFKQIGAFAVGNNVRLSFHPGQFCVLASDRADVVEKSILEFEYHAYMAKLMGYGQTFQDLKVNVHISGKQGPKGIRDVYNNRLSTEARNVITIENEEFSYGIDDCLELADIIPIVFDYHHHWVKTGNYLNITDPKVQQIIDSWRDVRPVMHYSQSKPELFIDGVVNTNASKSALRAHSDDYWNSDINAQVFSFWEKFDIMCECKLKNLGMQKLFNEFKPLINIENNAK
jgi:UV DNA damage endonuclease